MALDDVRSLCRSLPGVTEDVKWGKDLVFSVGGRMFAAVCLDPPHSLGFKCAEEDFAALTERPGVIPAPYLARALWVQETELGAAIKKRERERLIRSSYEIVKAKLPKRHPLRTGK